MSTLLRVIEMLNITPVHLESIVAEKLEGYLQLAQYLQLVEEREV